MEAVPRFAQAEVLAAYASAMAECNEQEESLLEEYDDLCADLKSWTKARLVGDSMASSARLKEGVDAIHEREQEVVELQANLGQVMERLQQAFHLLPGRDQ